MLGIPKVFLTFTRRLLHMKQPDLVRRCFTVSSPLADFLLLRCVLGTLNINGSWKAVKYPIPEKGAATGGDGKGTTPGIWAWWTSWAMMLGLGWPPTMEVRN